MKTSLSHALALAVLTAFHVACGGSDDSSGSTANGGCNGSGSPLGGTQSSACSSCVASKCSAESTKIQSDCSALLSCTKGCGCSDTSCLQGCGSKLDATCQAASSALSACESSMCKSECSSGAGGSGGSGGSGGGTFTPSYSCTQTPDGGDKTCIEVVSPFPGGESGLAQAKQTCMDDGGTVGTACDKTGLLGVCTFANTSKAYYYQPNAAGADALQMACTNAGGTWDK